jgi:hypothetical protein
VVGIEFFVSGSTSEVSQMKYRHYKGGIYEIVCEAKLESDPSVTLIIYKSANGLIWARPSEVFFETIEIEGKTVQRFAPIDETTT